jgi:dipeptidyl aminopeptidase/acylaminoacyl peptidase
MPRANQAHTARPLIVMLVATLVLYLTGTVTGKARAMQEPGRRLTIEDILHFKRLVDVRISPDANYLLYTLVEPGASNVYGERACLWLVDLTTKRKRKLLEPSLTKSVSVRLTTDPQPQWSPNGRQIGYLSARKGHAEIWLLDVATGATWQLTRPEAARAPRLRDAGGTVREFAFNPAGDRIAYVRTFFDTEHQQQVERRKIIAASEYPRAFSLEGVDGSFANESVIESVSVTAGRSDRLTPPLISASGLKWSPDGRRLAFVPLGDTWLPKRISDADPMVLTLGTKRLTRVVRTWSADWFPTWSPDGSTIGYLSVTPELPMMASRALFTIRLAGGEPRRISGLKTVPSYRLPVVWANTGVIYAASLDRGTMRVYAFAPDGGSPRLVTPERFHVRAYSLSADGRRMAAIFENANTPPEVYVGDPMTGVFERLTSLGDALQGVALGHVERVTWRSGDDRFDVEGFLVEPPDFAPRKRYPLLVNLHGGPGALYENGFTDVNFTSSYHTPAQLYAAHGYLVFLPNKRGDPSYGADFLTAHVQRWGDDVEYDMLAGVDALVARGLVNPNQLGVMGHSYGGYATAWAISHTTRFKAASISDGPVNLLSYFRQIYDTWQEPSLGGSPTAAQETYLERSPILYVRNIETPTLLRYGQAKFPRGSSLGMPLQGLEFFNALRERGVPVEFLYHPTQGHVVVDAEVYRDWVARNLRWFDYWVLGEGSNPLE